jgi:arylsulfatase A-like enzyme
MTYWWQYSLAVIGLGLSALLGGQVQARPNILVFLTDDQDMSLVEQMPNVKALIVDKGATFTHAFYNDPLCCPSRATMLTGRYVQNTRTVSTHGQFFKAGMDDKTVAVWLDEAGYRTALIGKYLNGYPHPQPTSYVPPGWDHWLATSGQGYYEYRLIDRQGRAKRYGTAEADYQTDVLGKAALDFLNEAVSGDEPFFLWLSLHPPHTPSTPALRHSKLLPNLTAPKPASFNEADVGDKPAYVRSLASLSPTVVARLDEEYRKRARSLLAADELMRLIVDKLTAVDRLDETYIVFASDNGWMLGQHRITGGKGLPYEESIRMVLHVRGPGIAAGRKLQHLVGNVDFAATFAEWAGAAVPEAIDGRSFAPLLESKAPTPDSWRQSFPLFFKRGSIGTWPGWRGIRTRKYTYVEYDTGERELYDTVADPFQLTSLHQTAPATLRRKLAQLTAMLAGCKGEACRNAENTPVP